MFYNLYVILRFKTISVSRLKEFGLIIEMDSFVFRLLTSSIQHLKRLGRRKSAANEMIDRDSRCLMMSSVVLSILRVLLNVTHENGLLFKLL